MEDPIQIVHKSEVDAKSEYVANTEPVSMSGVEEVAFRRDKLTMKELSNCVVKLLALLAIDSHGPFPRMSSFEYPHSKEDLKLLAVKRERLLGYVDSLSEVMRMEDSALRMMVEMACQEPGVVTKTDGLDYVVIQTVRDLMTELKREIQCSRSSAMNSAWLVLIMKMLITHQVRCNLYDARARASFKRLVRMLGEGLLPWKEIVAIESQLAEEYDALLCDGGLDPQACQSVGRYAKVALAALSGGALMLYTGSVAAPSIAASLFALCTAGGSMTQLSSSAAALMSYWGLTSTSCISSIFAATGVGVTGYKMTQRTRGLTEFHLVPLHSSFPLEEARSYCSMMARQTVSSSSEEEKSDPLRASISTTPPSLPGGLPVFVLIPGWFEEEEDARRVWGGATLTACFSSAAKDEGGDNNEVFVPAVQDQEEEDDDEWLEAETVEEEFNKVEEREGEVGKKSEEEESASLMGESWENLDMQTSGWWRECVPSGEEHVLVWETQILGRLYRVMKDFVWNEASRYALDEIVKHTALAGLTSAAALPMTVLDAARKLDNPWQMAIFHAQEAGLLLANVLLSRPQGSRPVTLMGYSMGARVIFHCLETLAERGEEALGIVENAVLLGCPIGRNPERWRRIRAVVAGRLINGFSSNDWILMFLFRSKAWELGLAGLSPVEVEAEGQGAATGTAMCVENVDLTDMVPGHLLYPKALPNIMAKLRLED